MELEKVQYTRHAAKGRTRKKGMVNAWKGKKRKNHKLLREATQCEIAEKFCTKEQ